MEVRFAGIARIADLRDRVARVQPLTDANTNRALVEMAEQDVSAAAAQDGMVAGEVSVIDSWHRHIGQPVNRHDNLAIARRDDLSTED